MHTKSQIKRCAECDLGLKLSNPTPQQRNENKKNDNSRPNEFCSGKLPNSSVMQWLVYEEAFPPQDSGGRPHGRISGPFPLQRGRRVIR